ncbi:AAA family ATPase [Candidatus Magnetominusculus dajiuhuensis]|uniref:AAA family ATPase n=1 Tax=Candidatus Magnetominusculus dajiuhuensis TaxID=3137712 RepID=UPI003B43AF16
MREENKVAGELIEEASRKVQDLFDQLASTSDYVARISELLGVEQTSGLLGVEQTNVFSDRIDSHFSSITIESYKVFKNLCFDKLARINLVAGLNNSGKTSLLEAIYLLARQNDFNGILGVIQRRGKIPEERIQAEWLVNQIARPIAIKGVFDGKLADVTISVIQESNASLDMSKYLKSVEIASNFDNHKQESMTRIFKGQERVSLADSIKLLCNAIYSSPFFMNEPRHYSTFYHASVRSKSLPKIFDFIRQEIVPTISDIRLIVDSYRFLVTDSRFDEPLDLTSYGEGLQRIFFMSLLFASAQNGILLIDEFENAIHVDLMARFAPFVYKLAIEFNVQVFLTSHSKECIDSFVQNIDKKEDISLHALIPSPEKAIDHWETGGQEYSTLLRVADVDLRKAQ